ncbi:hypothetical protein ACO03V_03475 [Microbacterium sp. HMH0099]|uniref:hypothetical protein n=1 Tax=Microbacterium sp. HMH0099 TaxID=3414026 RepID=UPI003BF63875
MTRSVPFDSTPLTAPVTRAEVKAYTAQLRREGHLGSPVLGVVILCVVGAVFLLALGPILIAVFATILDPGGPSAIVAGVLPFVIFVGIVALAVWGITRGLGGAAERRFRLARFARANGMRWLPRQPAPALPGLIFGRGSSRAASDLIRGENPRFVEIANYRYTTGSGKNRQTHRWGYVAIRLDVPLPHIVLDATGNNGLFGSNLPLSFGRDQRLSLEGDFDEHFALYCPSGYERDALYLFTPDVMARFIDNAAALDVEIVDDWLFLYAKRDLSTLDPATWAWLFTTVAALLDKLAQWARWRDERLEAVPAAGAVASGIPGAQSAGAPVLTPPPAGVAPAGRRLRRGFSWVAVVLVVAVGLYVAVTLVATVLGS